MNPIIDLVCQRRGIRLQQFVGGDRAAPVATARREVIESLKRVGYSCEEIAKETGLHVQTVYYWLKAKRREQVRRQSAETFSVKHLGGPKQTKQQREEILTAYLESPSKGTALACSRGLSPLYAYKLALAMGAIPRKGEQ